MRILAIDTSTRSGGAAITEGNTVLASVYELADGTPSSSSTTHAGEQFSSRLFKDVESVLAKAGLKLRQIDIFAATAGPGSFTGVRVGLAAVKAWSEVYGKPIAAVNALEAVAMQSMRVEDGDSNIIAAFTDARRGQVYGAIFEQGGGGLRILGQEVVARPEEFIEAVFGGTGGRPVRFVSPAPEILQEAINGSNLRGSTIEKVSEDLSPWVGRLAFRQAQRGELVDALALDANYVRRMDAELYWKDS